MDAHARDEVPYPVANTLIFCQERPTEGTMAVASAGQGRQIIHNAENVHILCTCMSRKEGPPLQDSKRGQAWNLVDHVAATALR